MKDLRATLEKQIEMLEIVQNEALKNGDYKKVQEIVHTVMSITNMINSLKQGGNAYEAKP